MIPQFNVIDHANRYPFIAGWLCLDFANTVNYAKSPPEDLIGGVNDLIAWGCIAGLITPEHGARIEAEARQNPAAAQAALAEARLLRLAIYQLFTAALHGRAPDAGTLGMFNRALGRSAPRIAIRHAPLRFDFGAAGSNSDPWEIVQPVVWSAVSLLISPRLSMVRRCRARDCSRLFVDETRSHTRRWCSMKECGNRAKGRLSYARRKSGWWSDVF